MGDCFYIFGVVWGEARGGIRGKYGEDDWVRGCGRVYWEDSERFECGKLGWLGRFGEGMDRGGGL